MLFCHVVLAGGIGRRIWPISTPYLPKQFIKFEQDSFFQKTLSRHQGILEESPTYVLVGQKNFLLAQQQLQEQRLKANFIIEPVSRNTASACLIAALCIQKHIGDAILCFTPTDHYLPTEASYKEFIKKGYDYICANGGMLAIGANIKAPVVEYGYLRYAKKQGEISEVTEFIAKADYSKVVQFYNEKTHAYNSGIYIVQISEFIKQFKAIDPAMVLQCEQALAKMQRLEEDEMVILPEQELSLIKDVSIDAHFFSRCNNLKAMHWDGEWGDIGNWDGFMQHIPSATPYLNDQNNNCYFYSASGHFDKNIIAIGTNNLCVIETDAALFIADKDHLAELKTAVSKEFDQYAYENTSAVDAKIMPWGMYVVLCMANNLKIKLLTVNPQSRLSLQYHCNRSENWIVIKGTAEAELDGKVFTLHEGQHLYIPHLAKHRLSNFQDEILQIIEIQTGLYLEEDDIVRLEDMYNRV